MKEGKADVAKSHAQQGQLISTEDREVGDVDRKVRYCVVYALLHLHCSALVICC